MRGATYACDGSVRNLSGDRKNKEDPGLRISQRLPELIDLEVVVLDTLPVGSHSLHCDSALALSQEFRSRWQIREEEQRCNSGEQGQRSEDEEHIHPPSQAACDVADRVANESTEHGGDSVGAVVDLQAQRLLLGRVPHRHDQDESGVNCGFDETQHEAVGSNSGKVRARRCCH
jgi:hypothetical protein